MGPKNLLNKPACRGLHWSLETRALGLACLGTKVVTVLWMTDLLQQPTIPTHLTSKKNTKDTRPL